MIRTITQKCLCGYVYKEEDKVEIRMIKPSGSILWTPEENTKKNEDSEKEETVIRRIVLEGTEKFEELNFLTNYTAHGDNASKSKLLICPKCGVVLNPSVAVKIEEVE